MTQPDQTLNTAADLINQGYKERCAARHQGQGIYDMFLVLTRNGADPVEFPLATSVTGAEAIAIQTSTKAALADLAKARRNTPATQPDPAPPISPVTDAAVPPAQPEDRVDSFIRRVVGAGPQQIIDQADLSQLTALIDLGRSHPLPTQGKKGFWNRLQGWAMLALERRLGVGLA